MCHVRVERVVKAPIKSCMMMSTFVVVVLMGCMIKQMQMQSYFGGCTLVCSPTQGFNLLNITKRDTMCNVELLQRIYCERRSN